MPDPTTGDRPMTLRSDIILTGWAHNLEFADGIATWRLDPVLTPFVHLAGISIFCCQSRKPWVLEQLERMIEGQLIIVMASGQDLAELVSGAPLIVKRIELMGKPELPAA